MSTDVRIGEAEEQLVAAVDDWTMR